MKKFFTVAAVLILTIAASKSPLFTQSLKPTDPISIFETPQPTKVLGVRNEVKITDDNQDIRAIWYKVQDIEKVKLIPNFEEKLFASKAKETYGCDLLVNGGFYTKDDKPIGLFISDSKQLKGYVSSSLNNSVFSVNDFATARITASTPKDNLPIALQNGPMLFENGLAKTLKLKSDKPARRVVAAITGKNELVFIVFYNPNSSFEGPLLVDLPSMVSEFDKETNLGIADAMNLDGGTAAAFYSPEISLSEASMVGSFFCVQ